MYPVNQASVIVPHRRKGLITRLRLNELIQDLLEFKLVLVVAPPGYGKTSLFVDLARSTNTTVCWYAVDRTDDDINHFLAHFVASIRNTFPHFGGDTEAFLQNAALQALDIDLFVTLLANEIHNHIKPHFALVVDDFHLVDGNERIQEFISRFIQRGGEKCRLVLLTRTQPSLPDLDLMFARSQVGKVGIEDLAFTPSEIQALILQNSGQSLSDADATRLIQESGGWITGMLLSGQANWKGMQQQFQAARASGIKLYDYLACQVLDQQPPDLKTFLLYSSALGEFTAELCETILKPLAYPDGADWDSLMDEIITRNLFISVIDNDDRWLRYHPLFQSFLLNELEQSHLGAKRQILVGLANYYVEKRDWDHAYAVYQEMQDIEGTVNLLELAASSLLQDGRSTTLSNWLDQIPTYILNAHPALISAHGAALLMCNRIRQALPLLNQAEALQRANGDLPGLARTLERRSVAHQFMGNSVAAIQDADTVLEMVAQGLDAPAIEAGALKSKGINHHDLGDVDTALYNLQKALAIYAELDDESNKAKTLIDLGLVYRGRGDWSDAEDAYLQAVTYFRQAGDLTRLANVLNNLGVLNHHRGDYEQAIELLGQALDVARKSGYVRMEAFVLASLGDIYLELKAEPTATAEYAQSRQMAQKLDQHALLFYLDLAEATLASQGGNNQQALALIASAEKRLGTDGVDYQIGQCKLQRGIISLKTGETAKAQVTLTDAIGLLGNVTGQPEPVKAQFYLAIAHHRLGNRELAHEYARSALSFIRNVEDQHLLILVGEDAVPLLQDLVYDSETSVLAANLLAGIMEFRDRLPALHRRVRGIAPNAAFIPPQMTITALGLMEVRIGEQVITNAAWYSRPQKDMFFFILAHPDGVSEKAIEAVLWPDTRDPHKKFENTLYHLREKVNSSTILQQGNRYYFNRTLDYQYDVERFEDHARWAQASTDPDEKARHYRQMLTLYGGLYLPEAEGTWFDVERERLRQIWFEVAQNLVQYLLDRQDYAEALKWSLSILELDDSAEEVHCLAMRAYAGMGNRPAVDRQFDWCQRAMQEHHAMRPSKETVMLYQTLTR
jgi:ATP/maltotriose-dependent transcriptional regulator MalT/DNA-binding SARP family transcriptional activator